MKTIKVSIEENGMIQLPQELMNQMQLNEDNQIELHYEPDRLADKCFIVEENRGESLTNDEFYCIPMKVIEQAGIEDDDLQIILGEKEVTLTTTMNVLSIVPTEFLAAMIDQNVNLTEIADNVVERINNNVFETEEYL